MPSSRHSFRRSLLLAMGVSPTVVGCGPVDADDDGYSSERDCDDANPRIHPGVAELCDNVDNDCDGIIDVGAVDQRVWYADMDGDGYGDRMAPMQACSAPSGWVSDHRDCSPADGSVHPGATEAIDKQDNDCDGMVDEVTCPESARAVNRAQVRAANGRVPLTFCLDKPVSQIGCPAPSDVNAQRLVERTVGPPMSPPHADAVWFVRGSVCGPDEQHVDSCCYVLQAGRRAVPFEALLGEPPSEPFDGGGSIAVGSPANRPVHGRPLTVDGTPIVARPIGTRAWGRIQAASGVWATPEQRLEAAVIWRRAAFDEHASIASFARFAMELMAVGAPPELVMGATRAQSDEIRHAQQCFSVASMLDGRRIGPGPMAIDGAFRSGVDMGQLLVDVIEQACINETLAAAEAGWLSERASFGNLASILAAIALDERRHAALGWKTARWILGHRPALRVDALRTFSRVANRVNASPTRGSEWMVAMGCMPDALRRTVHAEVWSDVVQPCSAALLSG